MKRYVVSFVHVFLWIEYITGGVLSAASNCDADTFLKGPSLDITKARKQLLMYYEKDEAFVDSFVDNYTANCTSQCLSDTTSLECTEASIAIQTTIVYGKMKERESALMNMIRDLAVSLPIICLGIIAVFFGMSLFAHYYYRSKNGRKSMQRATVWSTFSVPVQ